MADTYTLDPLPGGTPQQPQFTLDPIQQPSPPGLLSGLERGIGEAYSGVKGTVTGPFTDRPAEAPASDELSKKLAESIYTGWKDPSWWTSQIGHALGSGAPTLAAGLIGTGVGGALTAETGPGAIVGAGVGGALGAGFGSALQSLYPAYAAARAEGLSHDDAVKRAIEQTGIGSATAGIMGALPGVSFLGRTATGAMEKPIGEALLQIFAAQPAVGVAGQAAQTAAAGKPVTLEDLATGYATNAALGAGFLGGERLGAKLGSRVGEAAPEPMVSTPAEKLPTSEQTRPNVNPPEPITLDPIKPAPGPWGPREVGPWGARPPETEPTLPAREDLQTATGAAPVKAIPNVEPDTFRLISQHAEIQDRLSGVEQQLAALPEGDHSAVDRLARLQEVEARLANPDIAPQERRAAMQRRDQILVDTTPEALRAAAAPIEQRRALEAQQASLEGQLADIAKRIMPPAELAPAEVPRLGAAEAMPVRAPEEATAPEAPKTPEVAPTEAVSVRGPWGPRTPETPTTGEPSTPIPTGEAKPAAAAPESAPPAETSLPTPRRGVSAIGRTVQGTGETKPFGLSESVEEAAGRDLGDLPTTQVIEDAPQLARVRQIFDADPQRGMDIAMGDARPPKDLLARHFYTEAVNRAVRAGDLEATRRLATKSKLVAESKLMGAEISALRNIEPGNPAVDMTRVQDARREELAKRGVDVPRAIAQTVKEIRAVRAKTAAPSDAWEKFMAEIVCR